MWIFSTIGFFSIVTDSTRKRANAHPGQNENGHRQPFPIAPGNVRKHGAAYQ
jgi:hypothetical protein